MQNAFIQYYTIRIAFKFTIFITFSIKTTKDYFYISDILWTKKLKVT